MTYTATKATTALTPVTQSSWGPCYSSTANSKYIASISGTALTDMYVKVGYAGAIYYYKKFEPSQGDVIKVDNDSYYVKRVTVTTTSYTKL